MPVQSEWRFCHKCNVMFFNGFPNKGNCPSGGEHEAAGFTFVLSYDGSETSNDQINWRFCHKCTTMFFDGFSEKGRCPSGGGHEAAGFNFILPHDKQETPTAQGNWRFCHKCNSMFFDGFPNKGNCPTGSGHEAAGFNFDLPHLDPDLAVFDSGSITSNLPLGGSVHLIMRRNGDFTFSTHAHDSGFDNIDYGISAILMTADGVAAFTFEHSGHCEGTVAGLPFGTPRRDDDFLTSGNNPMVSREFDRLGGAVLKANLNGKDTLVGSLGDLLKEAANQFGKVAADAVIALVA